MDQNVANQLKARVYLDFLIRYLRDDAALFAGLALLLGTGIVVSLIAPWFAAKFVDTATEEVNAGTSDRIRTLLFWLASGFLVAGILSQVLRVAIAHLGSHIAWRAGNRLRVVLVNHCLGLDLPFHHEHGPGVMVERIDGDVRRLNHFFTEFFLHIIGNLALLGCLLAVITVVDWRVGLTFVVSCVVALGVLLRLRHVASPRWNQALESNAVLYNDLEERFGAIPDIRSNGAAAYVMNEFSDLLRNNIFVTRNAVTLSVVVGHSGSLVIALATVTAVGVSAYLHLNGALTLGAVVMVSMYGAMVSAPLGQIILQVDDFPRSTAAITRIRELLGAQSTIQFGRGAFWPKGAPSVAFENVSFAYPLGKEDSVRNVDFAIQPNEVVGLIGKTGAGKSTLTRLLLRFYDPTEGRVLIDGKDIRDATKKELRGHIGVVTQEVHLFDATLRENVALFASGVSDERIVEVFLEVGLGAWYRRQPEGLDTRISGQGERLSGGEAQLIGVARVFLVDPGLVILDEPTSRLDPVTERRLDRAFDNLLSNRTAVIIAHRLETLHRVDKILVVEDGKVVEFGERQALADDPTSKFAAALARGTLELS